jgi:arsenite/tail-anchored protein-transporting ATPase
MATPRTILYTGKGGVGKTSVAAASARRCAESGLRTIIVSTDPAHSLSDSFETELGPDPTLISPLLWGQEVQAEREMEANWGRVQAWLGALLADRGVMDIAAEELSVPPGMDELFSLLQIKRHHDSGDYDAVIVDCAPTGETLRLLGFPDIANWWLEKVFPWERRLIAAAKPLARMIDVEIPGADVIDEVQGLVRQLIAMNEILRDRSHASIRLVMTPDRMVVKEAQRTFTYLNLYGYLTDAVIVNRIFPDELADGYFAEWRERQQRCLEEVEAGFSPVPVLTARYYGEEVVGAEMLDRLGEEIFTGDTEPAAMLHHELAHELESANGNTTLRIAVPFGERGDVSLKKVGPELIVSVGQRKRTIILPTGLARRSPTGATLRDGALEVSFATTGASDRG